MKFKNGFAGDVRQWLRPVCALLVAGAAASAVDVPATPRPGYVIENAPDVDRNVATVLAPRKPPMDTAAISNAWKGIVADCTRAPVKIIFDTDIGTDIDDAFALAFALRRRELQVCAITTSRGEVEQRAAIVSRLLQVLGRQDIPFAPGSPKMINGSTLRDKPVDQFPFAGPEGDRPRVACPEAQELFRRTIQANWGEVWLVVLGPMTNAALLLRDHAELAPGLKGIVCMGGEPWRAHVETNLGIDPEAATIVCHSGLLKFAGTDDVTMRLLMPQPDMDRLGRTDTPVGRALTELNRLYRTQQTTKPGPVAFDVCPLVWLFAPELFSTESRGVAVNDKGLMTLSPTAPPCALSTNMNAVAVHRLLMDTLAP
jgi:pyrimidine-specific ribonucleoside hydrolase